MHNGQQISKGGENIRRIGLGIDIGKKRCEICIKGYNILDRFSISDDNNGISILLNRLKSIEDIR